MDFKDIKVIWDSQDNEPFFALNQTGLHAMLLRKSRSFKRAIFWRDLWEISLGTIAGAGFLVFAGLLITGQPERLASWFNIKVFPTSWDLVGLLTAAALWFHYAIYQFVARKRQARRERQFAESLCGDLDREIARTKHQIRMLKSVLWWGVLPVWAATFLFLLVAARWLDVPGWVALMVAAMFLAGVVFDLRCKQGPINRDLSPRKRELESLREKLNGGECQPKRQLP